MGNLISPQEMEQLTGANQPRKQCDILRNNGIRFTVRADGRPALSWEAYNRQLSGAPESARKNGPNLAAV